MASNDTELEQRRFPDVEKQEKESLNNNGTVEGFEREHWSHQMDSMFSLIGYCVGLGNIWRFPYFCMRNGGGSFLLAFLFFLVVCGLPMFFLDLAIGQFTGKTVLHSWEVCPLLKGIGPGVLLVNTVISTYYTTIIAWTLFYLGKSFYSPLPWTTCDNSWNTNSCIADTVPSASVTNTTMYLPHAFAYNCSTNVTNSPQTMVTSGEEFWQRGVLELSSGIEDLGGIPWHLCVSLLAAWVILFLCLARGIHSSGKVVYVTASLPYILLTVLLIRASLLPGAGDGVLYYITPNFKRLGELQVWLEAAIQMFYSLGPAWGPIVTLASYNKFNNNCYRDAIKLTLICEGTSIFGGFVVFAVLGYIAHDTGKDISEVVTSGPGLVFMTYPEALSKLPLPNLWSVLFFLMILSVGLDTQFTNMETIVAAIIDEFPALHRRRVVVHLLLCIGWFLFGLIMISQGGMYVIFLLDWYIGLVIPVFGFLECVIIGWIYGIRFSRDVSMMIGYGIPVLMRIALCLIVPAMLLCIAAFAFGSYKPPTYGVYHYPQYAIIIGIVIGALPFLLVIVLTCFAVKRAKGKTLWE
ncbi:sodium- and chloride-dependent glycine transporter 2-like, partial [Mizuhopecten yessoensis]|uniref:sodium- and chloride-dependent glycine transporter 2-like n=1 Tax=Mizuhopecten yessoensis TaxID=6573 RepID=UPI000B457D9D